MPFADWLWSEIASALGLKTTLTSMTTRAMYDMQGTLRLAAKSYVITWARIRSYHLTRSGIIVHILT